MALPRLLAVFAFAAACALAGVLYGMMRADGNSNAQSAGCTADADRIAALNAASAGELTAFTVVESPATLPRLAFADENGDSLTLEDRRGKVILVNLWATWCVPCREEMPDFAALQAAYGGANFEIVAINLDRSQPEKAADFLKEVGADNLALYTDRESATFQALKSEGLAFGLPSTLLVDETGCRIGNLTGPAKWDSPDGRAVIEAAINRLLL